MDSKKSCKDCPDRWVRLDGGKAVTCHSECPDYAERRAASEKEYDRRRKQCLEDFDFKDFKTKSVEKAARKHKWWS